MSKTIPENSLKFRTAVILLEYAAKLIVTKPLCTAKPFPDL